LSSEPGACAIAAEEPLKPIVPPRLSVYVLALLLALAAAACSSDKSAQSNAAADAAVEAPSSELEVAASEVELVDVSETQWTDASLGCREAGMSYAQVTVPGYTVVLRLGRESFEYHSNTDGSLLASCGLTKESSDGRQSPFTIEEALDDGLQSIVRISGFLVATEGGAQLCGVLMESYPPQCGNPKLALEGLDLASFPDLTEAGSVTWSDQTIEFTGRIAGDTFRITPR
jgi:hypothetical protein